MQPQSITRRILAPLLVAVAIAVVVVPARGDAPGDVPGQGWRESPIYLPLFTPRLHRTDYTIYTSAAGLDEALRELGGNPTLLHAAGSWEPRAMTPADAFGEAAEYNRWTIAALYGAKRARVARGARGAGARVTEAWTLVSPYPDPALERLQDGTMLIVLHIRDE